MPDVANRYPGSAPMFKKLLELLTLKWLWDRR
jgi:hypothetical protein